MRVSIENDLEFIIKKNVSLKNVSLKIIIIMMMMFSISLLWPPATDELQKAQPAFRTNQFTAVLAEQKKDLIHRLRVRITETNHIDIYTGVGACLQGHGT